MECVFYLVLICTFFGLNVHMYTFFWNLPFFSIVTQPVAGRLHIIFNVIIVFSHYEYVAHFLKYSAGRPGGLVVALEWYSCWSASSNPAAARF